MPVPQNREASMGSNTIDVGKASVAASSAGVVCVQLTPPSTLDQNPLSGTAAIISPPSGRRATYARVPQSFFSSVRLPVFDSHASPTTSSSTVVGAGCVALGSDVVVVVVVVGSKTRGGGSFAHAAPTATMPTDNAA